MELIEKAQGKLKELKFLIDEATGFVLPSSIVAMISDEFVTNEAYLFEAALLHMCWEKQPASQEGSFESFKKLQKFLKDVEARLMKDATENKTIYNYMKNVDEFVPLPKFRDAVGIVTQGFGEEEECKIYCHRLYCFYRSAERVCVCGDPIIPDYNNKNNNS